MSLVIPRPAHFALPEDPADDPVDDDPVDPVDDNPVPDVFEPEPPPAGDSATPSPVHGPDPEGGAQPAPSPDCCRPTTTQLCPPFGHASAATAFKAEGAGAGCQLRPPSSDTSPTGARPSALSPPTALHIVAFEHDSASRSPDPFGMTTEDHVAPPSVVSTSNAATPGTRPVSAFGPIATQSVEVGQAMDRKLCIPPTTGLYAQVSPPSVLTRMLLPTAMQVVDVGHAIAPRACAAKPGTDTADQLAPASTERNTTPEKPPMACAFAPTATHSELDGHATESRSAADTGSLRWPHVEPPSAEKSTAPTPTATQWARSAQATSLNAATPDGKASGVHVLPPSALRASVPWFAVEAPAAKHIEVVAHVIPSKPATPRCAPPGSGISGAETPALIAAPGGDTTGGPDSASATPTDPAATPNTPSAASTIVRRRRLLAPDGAQPSALPRNRVSRRPRRRPLSPGAPNPRTAFLLRADNDSARYQPNRRN